MSLFKKVAAFTDLHVGLKGNSQLHLQDCEEFVDWFIEKAKDAGCDTGIFLGDWHHQRNSINLITLDTSVRLLEKLGKALTNLFGFPATMIYFLEINVMYIVLPSDVIFLE